MPLVDVVFLLLTFFVFSLVLMVRADTLNVSLPRFGSGDPLQRETIVTVTVDAAGTLFLAGEPVDLADLGPRVRDLLNADADAPPRVVLAADEGATAGVVLHALDALAAAGVTDVAIIGAPTPPIDNP